MYDYEMTNPVCFAEKDAIDIVQNCNAYICMYVCMV